MPESGQTSVAVRLVPIPAADLPALARGQVPAGLEGRVLADGLPPPHVAARIQRRLAAGKPAFWVGMSYIYDRDGCCIGGCGFKDVPREREVEIGYGIAEPRRGRGYASVAVQQLLLTAAATSQVDRVVALIDADNIASSKLARRLGFVPGETVSDEGGLSVRWCRVLTQADTTAQDQ